MTTDDILIAVLVGITQGIVEWLPISSQGNVSIVITLVTNIDPVVAVDLALFVQLGTVLSAATYYREDIKTALTAAPDWRPRAAYANDNAELTFIIVASAVTGIIGIPLYLTLREVVSGVAGGLFIAVIGVLLIGTGMLQYLSSAVDLGHKAAPTLTDSLLVGALQGLTILPGVSRSGTTVSALLFRGYAGSASLRLSFLLSIPASIGAAGLVLISDGLPGITLGSALVALAVSAVVGFLSIDALMRVVERIPFSAVCVGLGIIATVSGLFLV